MRPLKIALVLCGVLLLLVVGGGVYSQSSWRLGAILSSYLPGVTCDDAVFRQIAAEEALYDYRYEYSISASSSCIASIRRIALARGYRAGDPNSALTAGGLWHEDHPGAEVVVFRFGADGRSAVWVRDKT